MKLRQLIVFGVLMELTYLSFYFLPESPTEVLLFMGVNAFAFFLLTILLLRIRSEKINAQTKIANPQTLLWVLGFAILFRLTLVFHPPVGSDDIYRYVWDGKVAAHGINPFAFAPTDSSLAFLRTDELPSRINHPTMRTIYPPLAQGFFWLSQTVFGDSVSGMKFLFVLADIGTILLLVRIMGTLRLKSDSWLGIILYAWSPLPVMYFALDGHIDALGIPFLLFCLLMIGGNRNIAGALALGLAVLAKLYPMFLAPFLFRIGQSRNKLLLPLIPAAMLAAGYWFYWEPTRGIIESFAIFNSKFEFNGSTFHLLYAFILSNEKTHLVCSVLFAIWISFVFFLRRSFVEKVFLAFIGFVILAPVVQPWYLTWLAALLALRWSTAVFVLLGLSNISNVVVYQFRLTGIWADETALLLIEYLPFFGFLVWEIAKGKFGISATTVIAED